MRALVFGVPPEPFDLPDDANILTHNLAHSPVGLREVADPQPLHDDWVITRPRLTGSSRPSPASPPLQSSRSLTEG